MNDTTEPQEDSKPSNEQQAHEVERAQEIASQEVEGQAQPPVLAPAEQPQKAFDEPKMPPVVAEQPVKHDDMPEATYFGRTITEIRAMLLKGVLGCLIAAAAVAVFAILAGNMSDTAGRAISTIFIAIVHIGLLFLILPANHSGSSSRRSANLLINAVLVIVACSFFTAVAHAWNVMDSSLAGKLYGTFFVGFVSLLHTKALMDVEENDPSVRTVVRYNYGLVAAVGALIIGLIYLQDEFDLLSGFYGRLLGATLVVDVTLSIVAAVMHRIYMQQHPELAAVHDGKGRSSGGRVVLIILAVAVVFWVVGALIRALSSWS